MRHILLILLLVFISCRPPADGETLSGKVVSVADGDTFTMLVNGTDQVKVRLLGIDAPERGQDYGTKARQHLNDLCYGKTVTVRKDSEDQYGRVLGILYVGDMNVNEEMVRSGLAWYYRHFVTDHRLDSLEQLARSERLNIWSMKNPVPPYEFRKKNRRE